MTQKARSEDIRAKTYKPKREQAIDDISNIIAPFFNDPVDTTCSYCEAGKAVYDAGYRLVPDLKVLSEEEILAVTSEDVYLSSGNLDIRATRLKRERAISQATVDSIKNR